MRQQSKEADNSVRDTYNKTQNCKITQNIRTHEARQQSTDTDNSLKTSEHMKRARHHQDTENTLRTAEHLKHTIKLEKNQEI